MSDEKNSAPKPVIPIKPTRFQIFDHVQVRYTAIAEAGTPIEDILKPSFWKHVARDLKPTNEIVIYCEDMTWRAEVCVLVAGPVSANVALISHTDLSPVDESAIEGDGLFIAWAGPYHKYRITRKGTEGKGDEVVLSGFGTKQEADLALIEYRKVHSRKAA